MPSICILLTNVVQAVEADVRWGAAHDWCQQQGYISDNYRVSLKKRPALCFAHSDNKKFSCQQFYIQGIILEWKMTGPF